MKLGKQKKKKESISSHISDVEYSQPNQNNFVYILNIGGSNLRYVSYWNENLGTHSIRSSIALDLILNKKDKNEFYVTRDTILLKNLKVKKKIYCNVSRKKIIFNFVFLSKIRGQSTQLFIILVLQQMIFFI